jgi:hypothetical protein
VLRRVPVGVHLFGVPLNRENPARLGPAFNRLDQPILGPPTRKQTLTQLTDRLVMHGIDADLGGLERRGRTAPWLKVHLVSACVANVLGAVVDRSGPLRREILKEGTTEGDIDELNSSTDAENGQRPLPGDGE